jgi:hypothetical protein
LSQKNATAAAHIRTLCASAQLREPHKLGFDLCETQVRRAGSNAGTRVAGIGSQRNRIPNDMAPGSDLHAARVAAFHDAVLAAWRSDGAPAPRFAEGVWHWIERNHACNALAWLAEVRARRADAADAEIAWCKRAIDRHNHARREALALLDASLIDLLGDGGPGARLHSETPGAMIDRLSLLALQIRRSKQAGETDATVVRPDPELKRHMAQRRDLCECLDRLLRELADGQACVHVYAPG